VLSAGRSVAAGRAPDALTSEALSEAFGIPLAVALSDGRWTARRARGEGVARAGTRRP
jgi:iron complex transport system ATP-binding protein